jgi:hypothetical protein
MKTAQVYKSFEELKAAEKPLKMSKKDAEKYKQQLSDLFHKLQEALRTGKPVPRPV